MKLDRPKRLLAPVVIVFVLAVAALVSCSPGYVARAAWEEARILWKRRPIDEVLNDDRLDTTTRAKLELVVEARSFARRDLKLNAGDSFTSFSRLENDTLTLVLSASPVDRLEPHTWWFPIVGRVPYKGFFDYEEAEEARQRLEEEGYDTYLRASSAFSTLGWLPDPLLSTTLSRDSVGLVETVIHEIAHNTVWVGGEVKFNESFANFVGSVGAVEFYCGRGHAESLCQAARDNWHDTMALSEFLDELWDGLGNLYAEDWEDLDQLRERRREFLALAASHFDREYRPSMRLQSFASFDPTRLNNASLIARHLYYHRLYSFQALYERTDGLTAALENLTAALKEHDDPWEAVDSVIGNR